MEPEQAALAGELLGAGTVVPIHYDGFEIDPWYRPVSDASARFAAAATGRPYEARVLEPGESFEVTNHEGRPAGRPSANQQPTPST
jgi:L-ascorbate metabolism protein UlaG (beta-lactamase superfamily)